MRKLIRDKKQYKWWFLYAAIVCLYLIIKMYRDIYISSESQGGIWNYIQLLFVLLGFRFLFSKDRYVSDRHGNRLIKYFLVFSFWSLFLGFASTISYDIKSMYGLGMIPYGVLVLVTAIVFGNRVSLDTKVFRWSYISTFMALCVVFFLGRQQEILTESFEGAGMVASVYYILCFFPLVFAIKPQWRLILVIVVAICLLISNKRAGTLALGICIFYYYVFNKQTGRFKSLLLFVLISFILFFSINYVIAHLGVDVIGRIENIDEDGGSGRIQRWASVMNAMEQSSFFELVFGHGYESAYLLLGGEVHNDFLSVLFEYGIVSFIFYALYFIGSFRMWWKMRRDNYRYESSVFMLNIITLFLAMFSFYIIRPTYITASMFSYGLFMADWYKQKNQIGIC